MSRVAPSEANQILNALMHKINTDAGHRVLARAEDVPNVFFLRRPSGIMQLDIDTGGGLPAGGMTYVSGPDGVGKTYLLAKYLAYHQKIYGPDSRIAIATIESPPDHLFFRKVGVKVAVPDYRIEEEVQYRKDRGLPPITKAEVKEWKEQIGRVDVVTGATGEQTLEAVLDLVRTRLYGIVGVDSISVILPAADADKDLDEADKRASSASLLTKFSKKYHPLTLGLDGNTNETTLILLSQVRSNSKKAEANPAVQKYISDWAPTGAYAMRHAKLIDIVIKTGEKIYKGSGATKSQVGKYLCWELMKGKAGTHDGIRGEIEFYYSSFVDDVDTVLISGIQTGVIGESSKKFSIHRAGTNEMLADKLSKGDLLEKLDADLNFNLMIRREILAAKEIRCRYR